MWLGKLWSPQVINRAWRVLRLFLRQQSVISWNIHSKTALKFVTVWLKVCSFHHSWRILDISSGRVTDVKRHAIKEHPTTTSLAQDTAERPQTAEEVSQKNMFTTKKDKLLLDQHIWKTWTIQENAWRVGNSKQVMWRPSLWEQHGYSAYRKAFKQFLKGWNIDFCGVGKSQNWVSVLEKSGKFGKMGKQGSE